MIHGIERCWDCAYFEKRDVPKEVTVNDWPTQKSDGYCHKVFPRGYVPAGKPGGYKWGGDRYCFLFEARDEEGQMNLFDSIGGGDR